MGGHPCRAAADRAAQIAEDCLHWSCTESADTLIRPEAGRHTAQCIPGAEYREIEGWGHDMPLPAIPEVTNLILNFVKDVEADRRSGRAAAE